MDFAKNPLPDLTSLVVKASIVDVLCFAYFHHVLEEEQGVNTPKNIDKNRGFICCQQLFGTRGSPAHGIIDNKLTAINGWQLVRSGLSIHFDPQL